MGNIINERRSHGRIKFKGSAVYFMPEKDGLRGCKIYTAPVIDISETGALLILPRKSELGDILKVSFKLSGRMSSSICCQVADTREYNNSFLTGVEFIILRESDINAIREIIRK